MKALCINLFDRPDRWVQFYSQKFPFEVERFDAIKKAPGWVGCRESYLECLKIGQNTGEPFIIMEDDCQILGSWTDVFLVMKELPDNWDCLYLGATLNEPLKKYSEHLCWLSWAWTTHAIIWKGGRAVEHILQSSEKIKKIDVFFADEIQKIFNCFIIYPLFATQRNGISNISKGWQNYDELIVERYKKYT
jgi:hypothetical protein